EMHEVIQRAIDEIVEEAKEDGWDRLTLSFSRHIHVTDAGLERVKGLRSLQELNLKGTKITDAGLEHLARLRSLKELDLSDTDVGDAGLEHLTRLRSLQELDLSDTDVGDAGLEHLKGMKSLQHLKVDGTQITREGAEKLRRALPNCTIFHPDDEPIDPDDEPPVDYESGNLPSDALLDEITDALDKKDGISEGEARQSPKATEERGEFRFTVEKQSGEPDTTEPLPKQGLWKGITTGNNLWLKVSFDVSPTEGLLTGIRTEIGNEGEQKPRVTWAPEGASAKIETDGSFRYSDSHRNSIDGKFISSGYAHGTVSKPFFQMECLDGEYRYPPTEWRAAPE
ncbi:MAG: hypothetical protein ABIP48_12665, partial [Planctomycetota bacterium]